MLLNHYMKKANTLLCLIIGLICSLPLHLILQKWIIPDPCAYHTNAPGLFVDTFYNFPASNGYHPVWNFYYYLLILVTGLVLAFIIDRTVTYLKPK